MHLSQTLTEKTHQHQQQALIIQQTSLNVFQRQPLNGAGLCHHQVAAAGQLVEQIRQKSHFTRAKRDGNDLPALDTRHMHHGIEATAHDERQLRHAIPRFAQAHPRSKSVQRPALEGQRLRQGIRKLAAQLTALQKFCREAIAGVQGTRGHPFIVTEDTETPSSAAHDLLFAQGLHREYAHIPC